MVLKTTLPTVEDGGHPGMTVPDMAGKACQCQGFNCPGATVAESFGPFLPYDLTVDADGKAFHSATSPKKPRL